MERVYLICFGVGLIFTLICAVFGHLFGGDHGEADVGTGGHAEAGFDQTGMPGISVFSPTVMASFITAFGGFGMVFCQFAATRKALVSAPLAALGGVGIAAGVFYVFNAAFRKTQSSSEGRVAWLVGAEATVITPIPQHGVGEIAYVQGGTRYTAPARSESGAAVSNGQFVRIARVVSNQFYVTPV